MVLGISEDKDAEGIIKELAPIAKKIILTQARYRSMDCLKLMELTVKHNKNVFVEKKRQESCKKSS